MALSGMPGMLEPGDAQVPGVRAGKEPGVTTPATPEELPGPAPLISFAAATCEQIAQMRNRGATWATIGVAFGCGPKEAKAKAKKLAAAARKEACHG